MTRNDINKVLRALRFYAEQANWQREVTNPQFDGLKGTLGSQMHLSAIEKDGGKLARKALKYDEQENRESQSNG